MKRPENLGVETLAELDPAVGDDDRPVQLVHSQVRSERERRRVVDQKLARAHRQTSLHPLVLLYIIEEVGQCTFWQMVLHHK